MWKEFRKFALQGRVLDLAIGVIVGGAFQTVISSLINDIVTPVLSVIVGTVDFSNLSFMIGNTPVKYGSFLTNILNFLFMAFILFITIKNLNKINTKLTEKELEELKIKAVNKPKKYKHKLKKLEEELNLQTKDCPFCRTEISKKAVRCPNCTSELNI